jgi:hypothetical protein
MFVTVRYTFYLMRTLTVKLWNSFQESYILGGAGEGVGHHA